MIYYKAILPDRIETRATLTRTHAACLVVTWPTERGTSGYVTWCGTREDAGAKAVLERDRGNSADVAEAVEIDATEYRLIRAAARSAGRP